MAKWKIKLDLPSIFLGGIFSLLLGIIWVNATAKYDVHITLPLQVEDDKLKIVVDNIGDKPLTKQRLTVTSCYANSSSIFYPPDLSSGRPFTIEFKEKNAIEWFRKWDCSDLSNTNFEDLGFSYKFYRNKTSGRLVAPTQSSSIVTCGYCYWKMEYQADGIKKNYTDKTYSPVEVTSRIIGDNVSADSPDLEYYSTITMMLFDDRMLIAK